MQTKDMVVKKTRRARGGVRAAREAELRAMKCCPDCSQCEAVMLGLLDRELAGEEPASE